MGTVDQSSSWAKTCSFSLGPEPYSTSAGMGRTPWMSPMHRLPQGILKIGCGGNHLRCIQLLTAELHR